MKSVIRHLRKDGLTRLKSQFILLNAGQQQKKSVDPPKVEPLSCSNCINNIFIPVTIFKQQGDEWPKKVKTNNSKT